jgi:hypothetical protein
MRAGRPQPMERELEAGPGEEPSSAAATPSASAIILPAQSTVDAAPTIPAPAQSTADAAPMIPGRGLRDLLNAAAASEDIAEVEAAVTGAEVAIEDGFALNSELEVALRAARQRMRVLGEQQRAEQEREREERRRRRAFSSSSARWSASASSIG